MTLGQMKREWKADTGADRYRRGVYTFFWRATPFPFLTTFDAPERAADLHPAAPLQHTLAGPDPAQRPGHGRDRPATGRADRPGTSPHRRPTGTASIEPSSSAWAARRPSPNGPRWSGCWTRSGPSRARDRARASPPTTAAWTAVARVLLNLDEFVTRE